ncbi:hypothetical protein HN51_054294 [Arachis hypogaea]|nr:uncharacterized protein DS421_19g647330 [Arachis hypogaea]
MSEIIQSIYTDMNGEQAAPKTGCGKIFDWFKNDDRSEWLKDMRGGLGLIASIIAIITFQSALNLPGGVLNDRINLLHCSVPHSTDLLDAGAVLSRTERVYYILFLAFNTTCFVASLCVSLLLVSGLSLRNRFTVWLLLIGMCTTVTTLLLTYLMGVFMVMPPGEISGEILLRSSFDYLLGFFFMFAIVGLIQVLRFIIWGVRKCFAI